MSLSLSKWKFLQHAAMMLPTRKISNLAILLHEIDLTSLQKSFHLNSGQHAERNCATDILLVTVKLSLVHSMFVGQHSTKCAFSHFIFIFKGVFYLITQQEIMV